MFADLLPLCVSDPNKDPEAKFQRFVEKYKNGALKYVAEKKWNLQRFKDLPVKTQEQLIASIDERDRADLNNLVKNEQPGNHQVLPSGIVCVTEWVIRPLCFQFW